VPADQHAVRPATLAILVLIAVPQARAQVARPACADSAQTQAALTRCAVQASRISRERLDRLVEELRRTLDSAAMPGLDSSQAAWLAYARAHCRWDGAAFAGGSMQAMVVAGCMGALTEQRIDSLKNFLCGWPPGEPACEAARAWDVAADTSRRRP
jgi:uncharacterized protein YecT (DUF1311 family)